MKSNHQKLFNHTVHVTNDWVHLVDEEADFDNLNRSFRLLRATLHTLRDALPINETAQFSAQLPLLLRGVFFEGWAPSKHSAEVRDKAHFIERVMKEFSEDPLSDPEAAVAAVFYVINMQISSGEAETLRQLVREDLRELWLSPDLR